MASYRLSRCADADLMSIAKYTLETWGESQLARYLDKIESCCRTVAKNPALGRPCDHIRPGLRHIREGRHVIFYRQAPAGILVVRILHERMLPEKHAFEDEEGT